MLTRRRFAPSCFAPALLLRGMPSAQVSIACIGTGWQGMNNVRSFLAEPLARVVAVCDIDSEHRGEARAAVNEKHGNSDCLAFHEFDEVFARRDIDAVVLSLPDHWHGAASVRAAAAGKDVYGEKPIAHHFAEGQAIREAVRRYRRVWQTGSWQRSLTLFRRACELVRNGCLGRVTRVEVGLPGGYNDFEGNAKLDTPCPPPPTLDYQRWLGPAPDAPYAPARVHKNWRYLLDYGGGLLLDWIGHHMDIAHWGLGLDDSGPVEVSGRGTFPRVNRLWNAPAMYHVEAKYAQGFTIVIEGDESIIPRGTKWIGERGWLWVDRSGIDARPRSILDTRLGPGAERLPVSAGHHRQFLECVLSRGETLTPPGVALRSAAPGYLGLISILTGRAIRWDPARESIIGDGEASRLLSRPLRAPWKLL
jgi:predicted dehydrogenase